MDLNRIIALALRAGVMIGAALSVAGLVLWAAEGFPDLGALSGSSLLDVVQSGLKGNVAGIIGMGIIALIATPIIRVALSVFYFAREKDRKYVAITLLVFGMLLFALLSGKSA